MGGVVVLLAGLLVASCAWISPTNVPPPPLSQSGNAAVSPRQQAPAPQQFHRLETRSLPPAYPSAYPAYSYPAMPEKPRVELPLAPAYQQSVPDAVVATDPLIIPSAPSIFYAPLPQTSRSSALPSSPAQVLQAQPGPALSLDFNANSAWKRAIVPPGSNAATVGRVPPPAAVPGFTIGAGDTVQIEVLGRPELSARGNISGDGRVTAALIGAVNVGGLTTAQAAERLANAYREGQYLLAPQVTVTIQEYQSQQVTVLGEVRNPGRFPIRTRLSVLDGLALSGGINDQGASIAYLLRPEDSVVTRYEIDLNALIQAGAGQQYFELLAGDTLVVPKAQLFYIYGEVKAPNAYKLKPGMTVIQALSLAGGLTDKGSDRRIDIRRHAADGRLQSLSAALNDGLEADDVIYVRERLF